jgi:hypothetical protein
MLLPEPLQELLEGVGFVDRVRAGRAAHGATASRQAAAWAAPRAMMASTSAVLAPPFAARLATIAAARVKKSIGTEGRTVQLFAARRIGFDAADPSP